MSEDPEYPSFHECFFLPLFIRQLIYLQRRNVEFLMRFSLLSIDIIGKLVRVPDKSCLEVSFALFVTKSWKTFHTRPITEKYLHT